MDAFLPDRDIKKFIAQGGKPPTGATAQMMQIGGGLDCGCNGYGCNDVYIFPTVCTNYICDYKPFFDTYWNRIDGQGFYGSDDRQRYYIYLPDTVNPNSPVVLLIHGGGWMAGPNPEEIMGFPLAFSNNPGSINFVKDLLDKGYVVVSMLYRLVNYAKNNTEILLKDEQITDINNCVLHIRNNFPSCLNINANSIQVLGESAGGHLAFMWAYTNADLSYIKSVVSMYAPTNMNQAASFYYYPTLNFNCTGNFIIDNPNTNPKPLAHFPYFWFQDLNNNQFVESSVSALTCNISTINFVPYINHKATNTKFVLQSCIKTTASNPYTNGLYYNNSPLNALNSSKIVPTFIMHGSKDYWVPYKYTTVGMKDKLINTGGLIDSLYSNGPNYVVPTTYNTNNKHLLKLYHNANH